jgi:hypothetical protein
MKFLKSVSIILFISFLAIGCGSDGSNSLCDKLGNYSVLPNTVSCGPYSVSIDSVASKVIIHDLYRGDKDIAVIDGSTLQSRLDCNGDSHSFNMNSVTWENMNFENGTFHGGTEVRGQLLSFDFTIDRNHQCSW